jgi:hypothetical protein
MESVHLAYNKRQIYLFISVTNGIIGLKDGIIENVSPGTGWGSVLRLF